MVRVDHDTKPYWDGCFEKKLVLARCGKCAHWIHPPKAVCPKCWSSTIRHHLCSGDAVVYSFTETAQKEGDSRIIVWAELNESKVIVLGELDRKYGAIAIGDPLKLVWNELEDTFVPGFRKKDA